MQYVTWMMLHNLASQTGRIDVGIYFRRADVLVPQHGLDNTQVGTVFQQVGGKGVAERVGADNLPDSRLLSQFLHQVEHHDAGEVLLP